MTTRRRARPEDYPPGPYTLAAALLRISPKHACERAARGEIPGAYRIGRSWFVARPPLDRLLATGERPPARPPVAFPAD